MLLGKLGRRYWTTVQVLRIAPLFSATLWTHFELLHLLAGPHAFGRVSGARFFTTLLRMRRVCFREDGDRFDEMRAALKSRGRPHGPPFLNLEGTSQRYFFSSAGFSAGGGAGVCAGGAGVCETPDMPSLKLRIPSPNPFMISGIRLPPKKISMTARTTSQ